MKRAVVAALGLVPCAYSSLGQVHIKIWGYAVEPYNQMTWSGYAGRNDPINDTSVQFTIWYAAGSMEDHADIYRGPVFTINPAYTYNGGGYYDPQTLVTPNEGQYTFYIQADYTPDGGWHYYYARTPLYEVTTTSILFPAEIAPVSPILLIPEASSLTLLGLGAVGLTLVRKRE